MATLLFYALAIAMLGSAAATVWLKKSRHAAYALIATMLAGTGIVAWLHAGFLALVLLLTLFGGSALLLLRGLPFLAKRGEIGEGRPDEDRSFWAGIVAVLFFVITYRILATSLWGAADHSDLALSEAQQGFEAVRAIGEALRGEYALALIGGLLIVGLAIAVSFTLIAGQKEA